MSHPPLRVGMRLVGDQGYGPTVIETRYIGEVLVGKPISHQGRPVDWREGIWVLDWREWSEVQP